MAVPTNFLNSVIVPSRDKNFTSILADIVAGRFLTKLTTPATAVAEIKCLMDLDANERQQLLYALISAYTCESGNAEMRATPASSAVAVTDASTRFAHADTKKDSEELKQRLDLKSNQDTLNGKLSLSIFLEKYPNLKKLLTIFNIIGFTLEFDRAHMFMRGMYEFGYSDKIAHASVFHILASNPLARNLIDKRTLAKALGTQFHFGLDTVVKTEAAGFITALDLALAQDNSEEFDALVAAGATLFHIERPMPQRVNRELYFNSRDCIELHMLGDIVSGFSSAPRSNHGI